MLAGAVDNLRHPLPLLLLQLITIVLTARLLMNSRGLMELIARNVGYELGILSPRIFTMMVIMAIVTTFATSPLLSLSDRWRERSSADGDGEGVVVQGNQRS